MTLKILIVDNSAFMRGMIKGIVLKVEPLCEIYEAEDGAKGVEAYQKYQPNITFMDIVMPVLDGIEALKQIIKINQSAKVVMCTAIGDREKIVKDSIAAGAADIVTKPFKPEQIANLIKTYAPK